MGDIYGKPTLIRATSRASVKIHDSFYTVEYSEERALPQDVDFDINEERIDLWFDVNDEVDKQLEDIVASLQRR